jgi:hypothetical protein
MPAPFSLTARQIEALRLLSDARVRHFLLRGGSRSAKTFLHLRTIATRAVAAPASRHAVFRFRLSHIKSSVVADTWPKMMRLCFPDVGYELDKQELFATLPNDSQVWFSGLDDKDRTEKVLGQEYATIFLNECSQIPFTSRNMALTRLAQKCPYKGADGAEQELRLLALYDCNPPNKAHWLYKLFFEKVNPDSKMALKRPERYATLKMNPVDNRENLAADYIESLDDLPARMRVRFRDGEFGDAAEGALWTLEVIEKWRDSDVPDIQRIAVGVDPSGADDKDNAGNDEIGIVVVGLGTDGNAYVLEDLTLKAGPEKWGGVAVSAYDRHDADAIVGEVNFGGAMVGFVIQAAAAKPDRKLKTRPVFKKVTASRGKAVRAEPISVLTEQGKVRFAGNFPLLEEELCAFTTNGYIGSDSPNRADAMIWALYELFPGIMKKAREQPPEPKSEEDHDGDGAMSSAGQHSWMG